MKKIALEDVINFIMEKSRGCLIFAGINGVFWIVLEKLIDSKHDFNDFFDIMLIVMLFAFIFGIIGISLKIFNSFRSKDE